MGSTPTSIWQCCSDDRTSSGKWVGEVMEQVDYDQLGPEN